MDKVTDQSVARETLIAKVVQTIKAGIDAMHVITGALMKANPGREIAPTLAMGEVIAVLAIGRALVKGMPATQRGLMLEMVRILDGVVTSEVSTDVLEKAVRLAVEDAEKRGATSWKLSPEEGQA